MRWDGPIITDSGGFQVFSMGHGTIADDRVKGRSAQEAAAPDATQDPQDHRAGRRPRLPLLLDGARQFLGPEDSMRVQAELHSEILRGVRTSARPFT